MNINILFTTLTCTFCKNMLDCSIIIKVTAIYSSRYIIHRVVTFTLNLKLRSTQKVTEIHRKTDINKSVITLRNRLHIKRKISCPLFIHGQLYRRFKITASEFVWPYLHSLDTYNPRVLPEYYRYTGVLYSQALARGVGVREEEGGNNRKLCLRRVRVLLPGCVAG